MVGMYGVAFFVPTQITVHAAHVIMRNSSPLCPPRLPISINYFPTNSPRHSLHSLHISKSLLPQIIVTVDKEKNHWLFHVTKSSEKNPAYLNALIE